MTQHTHFIGIAGIGMSAIARILLQQGKKVSGSDTSKSPLKQSLRALGAEIFDEHAENNVPEQSIVVYTSDVNDKHIEMQAAKKKECIIMHRSEILAEIFHSVDYPLAVTGTHGKTTTSSLLAWVLEQAQRQPYYALGGVLTSEEVNSKKGEGPYFVIEADESDGSFLRYRPFGAIVTNIDLDHMNYYQTEDKLIEAFKQFTDQVRSPQHLVWCGDDTRLLDLDLSGICYGFGEQCDAILSNYRQNEWSSFFDLSWEGKSFPSIEVALPGKHMALNAAGVFILCIQLGLDEKAIRRGLSSFKGVNRRSQKVPSDPTVTVIDDYAHHPAEVDSTLQGIREAIGDARLTAVFQPHRYSRLASLVEELPQLYRSFLAADQIVVTDIYAAGEKPIQGIDEQLVLNALKKELGSKVKYISKDQLVQQLSEFARPMDVFVCLGAGDITHIAHALGKKLLENPPQKWRVGVAFGGPSSEHDVSVNSAQFVFKHLDPQLFEAESFHVSKGGEWNAAKSITDDASETTVFSSKPIAHDVLDKLFGCDVFFPVMHGTFGEDGIVQGFFEALGRPYVGCNHRASAVCMDKVMSKKLAAFHGLKVVPFVHVTEHSWIQDNEAILEEILGNIDFPLIVKPSHIGSSINVNEALNRDQLKEYIEKAFKSDTDVVVESRLKVRDIEFAVFGDAPTAVYPPGEVCTNGKIYSYEDKVGPNGPKITAKAVLPDDMIKKGCELAAIAYKACHCQGMARVDFLLDEEGNFWFNEINPIPGMTSISLYPQICEQNGLPPKELIKSLIVNAFARSRKQKEKWQFQPNPLLA
ncbi:MAG: UDP-N-acetylmuramate--L-alanine ligase [Parachlamydiales bacterium]|jgi:UDP-N-acetylmuramate--alanine ligase